MGKDETGVKRMKKEILIEYFLSENARIILDKPDRVDINGLRFVNIGGVRIIQTKNPFIELVHINYEGKVEYTQDFYFSDIQEIAFYKYHDPEYAEKEWEELYKYSTP